MSLIIYNFSINRMGMGGNGNVESHSRTYIIVDRLQGCGHSKRCGKVKVSLAAVKSFDRRGVSCKNARTVQFLGDVEKCPVTQKTALPLANCSTHEVQVELNARPPMVTCSVRYTNPRLLYFTLLTVEANFRHTVARRFCNR